jgi:phage/plasmid-like protein (TIGR03299 family)
MSLECHQIKHADKLLLKDSAWHTLGWVKGDFITRAEIDAAGITFNPVKHQLEYNGQKIEAYGVFHEDGTFISTCGKDYAIHPPSVLFDTTDEIIVAAGGEAKYAVAGVLGNYEKVWGLVDIKASIRVGDDEIHQYLMGLTSFDGSAATRFDQTNVRIVCRNTWNQAIGKKTANCLRIRHTAKSHRKLNDAREALQAIKADFNKTGDVLNFLANRYANPVDINNILDEVIAQPVAKSEALEKVRENRRRENIIEEILGIYESNDNDAFPEQRGTAYNLFNAITNYVDHERSTRTKSGEDADVKRSASAVLGNGSRMKSKALDVIVQYAGGMSVAPVRKIVTTVPEMPDTPILDSILSEV